MRDDPEVMFADSARQACLDVAQYIVDEIQVNPETPALTGRMRAGYQAETEGNGAKVVQRDAPYWLYVEFGHWIITRDKKTHKKTVHGWQHEQQHVRPAIEVVRSALS